MTQGYIKHKVYIPLENVDMDVIRKYYTIPMFEEKACDKCEFRKNKPNDNCLSCQAFLGTLELFSIKRINGHEYCLLPNGNFPKLQKLTGIDFSTYEDLRCRAKRFNEIIWTGQLRQGEIVNDIKSANQVQIVKQWLSPENRYGFIEAPPRTGKSVIGNFIAVRMGFRTLYIAHQKELLENFYKSLLRDTNLKEVEERTGKTIAKIIEKPKDFELIKDLDFCLITYQSFIHDFSKIKTYLNGNFGLAIIDEAHQAGAEVYAKFMSSLDCRYKLGLSATPLRKDVLNRVLFNVIGPVTVKSEAVGLVPEIEVLETGVCCKKRFNMWVYAMKFLQNNEYRNQLIVSEVEKDLKEHKCIIIPVDSKLHMTELVTMVNQKCGENIAIGYHSGVANRKNILKEIDSGKYRVVVAIKGMIKQGIDLLSPSMVYIQSPLSAQKPPVGAPFFYQLGNRVCTPYPGKRQPIIKLFIDDMPESYGCMMGLFMKEINPGLKPNEEGRPRYKTDSKTLNYFWKTLVNDTTQKRYHQQAGKPYNPKYDGERSIPSSSSAKKGSLASFDF